MNVTIKWIPEGKIQRKRPNKNVKNIKQKKI